MSENVNVCEYIESKCVHVEADCFDLEQIMESGQCFRIYKLSLQEQEKLCKSKGLENCESMAWYRVMAADKKVFVCQNGVHLYSSLLQKNIRWTPFWQIKKFFFARMVSI